MIFTMILIFFTGLVCVTIVVEYRRTKRLTLLTITSVSNVLYNVVNPALYYYSPNSVVIFQKVINEVELDIQASGLLRVILAATIFQLVLLCISFMGSQKSQLLRSDSINNKAVIDAATFIGWVLLIIGAIGVVWFGLKYNGHLWGLYEISYIERSPLFRTNNIQAFLILIGMYGATQLIIVYLLTDRAKLAVLILLGMTLHGIGMKSKFPVFWILITFVAVAVGTRKKLLKYLLPVGFVALVLMSMSILRGVENLSELPQYITDYWDQIGTIVVAPWGNDLPGPSILSYYILNSDVDFSLAPILDALKILIPSFIFDRGTLMADLYAQNIIGYTYELGQGLGWSIICDGYLLCGWPGILLVALFIAFLARYIEGIRTKTSGSLREFFIIVTYMTIPIFFLVFRESMGALIKQMLLIAAFIWLPTFLLFQRRSRRLKIRAKHNLKVPQNKLGLSSN